MEHWDKKHPNGEALDPDSDGFIIFDAKQMAKRLVNKEVTLEQAIDEADAAVRAKAVELAKWDLWDIQYKFS